MRIVYRQTTKGVRVTVVPFYLGLMGADYYVSSYLLKSI